jgi:hypothetical protein
MSDDRPEVELEARLRNAMDERATAVEPAQDGLVRIEEKLMEQTRMDRRQRGWLIGLASAAAVVAIVFAIIAAQGDDDSSVDVADPDDTTTSTTVEDTTTTTAPPTTITTVFVPTVDPATPLWPVVASSQRFDDPVAAARSFAVDLLGFTDPIVGGFQQGDSRSGEVEIRKRANGQPTTVLVRQLEDDAWWVIGANTQDIDITAPAPGTTLTPGTFTLEGSALAFEGHVNYVLYGDGVENPLAEGFVTGCGSPPACAWAPAAVPWHAPTTDYGVLVLLTYSAEDGNLEQATAIRVKLR